MRLTPERREQIERRVQRSLLSLADPDDGSPTPEWPDVYADDAGDLLHDLDVLERERDEARREVERLRRVAEAAEAVVSAQDKRWRIGLKGEAERNGAIERLRSMLAEWRRVRGLPEREGSG